MSYVENAVDFYDKLSDLIVEQAEWSQKTFGLDSERGPIGALKHLEKEAKEAYESIGTDSYKEELADCLLLLLDGTRRSNIKLLDLIEVASQKMIKNKARSWPKPTSDEPVEHIKND